MAQWGGTLQCGYRRVLGVGVLVATRSREIQRILWDLLKLRFQPGGNEEVVNSCVTLEKSLNLSVLQVLIW